MDPTRMNAIRILLVIAASTPALAGELSVVKDGKSAAATFEGAAWQRTDDGLTAEGTGRYLWAPKTVATSELIQPAKWLAGGRLMLNMRNYDRSKRNRQVAVSPDGGLTWTEQRFDDALSEAGYGHPYESILLARFPLETLKPEAVGDSLNPESEQPASK